MATAPTPRQSQVLRELNAELEYLETAIHQVRESLNAGDFPGALARSRSVQQSAQKFYRYALDLREEAPEN